MKKKFGRQTTKCENPLNWFLWIYIYILNQIYVSVDIFLFKNRGFAKYFFTFQFLFTYFLFYNIVSLFSLFIALRKENLTGHRSNGHHDGPTGSFKTPEHDENV